MGKEWMIMGIMELSADQAPDGIVKCSVFNQRTGCLFNPCAKHEERTLTARETEILSLIRHGYLSKEIAVKLGVSIHTVNNHRKNILTKLGAGNAIEAINRARILRLME